MWVVTDVQYAYWQQLVDDSNRGPLGSLVTKSKNLGDGGWCVYCRSKGKFSWVDNYGGLPLYCNDCKTKYPEVTTKD